MEVDLIPLSQLPSRSGIARSNLYNRLKDLKIKPVKQGRKAFVSDSSLQLLTLLAKLTKERCSRISFANKSHQLFLFLFRVKTNIE